MRGRRWIDRRSWVSRLPPGRIPRRLLMALPYLQSYNDPKIEKAYQRFLKGETQRAIAKALKIPPRTIARYCKKDGWLAERQARNVAADAPNVAAVAAEATAPAANATAEHESRA